ncbi:chromosomal replication initiator protein DnaA [Qiania dongpingensis]|uniref:Chromosomal replication initiator protein DnaA n=1 Tax=Qiania dongpingensis TaxID=2763669 RepID=A0A7G9G108_9FIRM|nr:chromosomal replication initiator protein DnaA [Qiania dongpingensis]QNM04490.1 chromosomal replication initiator protein DnaA [Qiania dongpingensis]
MLQKIRENWDKILQLMRDEYDISPVGYETWLKPLQVESVDEDNHIVNIVIMDPKIETIGLNFIKKKYSFVLQISIEEVTGFKCTVHFYSKGQADTIKEPELPEVKDSSLMTIMQNANLNPKYTFDTFVVGSNNKMAHAAALAVAESPAEIYNPLFIYGGVGLGKTHLMHSIANFILKNDPSKRIMYVTSEKFTNELIDSIRNKNFTTATQFREKYRNNDVLLVDDIQFIIGKESTQEEIFHTFNTLHEAKKQIIISSDRPPKEFETLEDRLVSRFEWGLTVDIQSPDYETRMAILRKKEEMDGYNIDNEVIKYIANNIKSNIRELEGALTKVIALSKLDNKEINLDLAEEALKDFISPNQDMEITPETIINVVADHYKCTPADLISSKRNKEIVIPRQIVMYLCRSMTDCPLQMIGKYLGGKDHTTIINGIKKITKQLDTDENMKTTIDVLKKKINPT